MQLREKIAVLKQQSEAAKKELEALRHLVAQVVKEKNQAYAERNALVCALSKEYSGGLGIDANMEQTNPQWRHLVFLDLPTGQVSWHVHETELEMFAHLPAYSKPYDGHTVKDKYVRVAMLKPKDRRIITL